MLALRNYYSRFLSRPKLNLFPLHVDWLLICKSMTSKRILLNTLSSHWPFPLHCQKKKPLFSPWLTAMLILFIAFLLASQGATPPLAWKLSSICSNLNDLPLWLLLSSRTLQSDILLLLFSQIVFIGHQKPFGHTLGGVVTGFIPVLLCSSFRHCHLLLPRFSLFPHLPYPPPMAVYSLISPLPLIVSFLCCSRIYSYLIFSLFTR